MRNYKKIEYAEKEYKDYVNTQVSNGTPFSEHSYGSRRNLIINNRVLATTAPSVSLDLGGLTGQKFTSFLAQFTKELYKRLRNSPELLNLKIEYNGVAKSRNTHLFDSIPINRAFYNIDLKCAYWQIAHRLGYISTEFYESYSADDYKKAKRYCITFLARKNKKIYRHNDRQYTIHCDITCLQNVYNNIRYELYKCISNVLSLTKNHIEFNIDGITVLADEVENVKKGFAERDLKFKITRCTKINNYQYLHGSTIRNFKKQSV